MSPTLQKLLICQYFIITCLISESNHCYAQEIIRVNDTLQRTSYYRYFPAKGESTLMLNSNEGNELYMFLQFSPDFSHPLYLVMLFYENKIAEEQTRAVFEFNDGTMLEIKNSGKYNSSSVYLFDLTRYKGKFISTPLDKLYLIEKNGRMSDEYLFSDHSDYLLNFFHLFNKLQGSYNAIATSDTIR
ncbi:MAG TPA: hypothetical protein VK212_07620 [Lentimicrobium sp.]|nr:hypothetical protein [Lentimicrobium sp.]